ncbi:uncharacterized protein BX663DRAFT_430253, partial [Cokeromyces recurvatus]|uniref:uncharacterized protein n=1 Tax=Cokeromyces recurvatus TaxID=90255 RepID=UPI00221F88B1
MKPQFTVQLFILFSSFLDEPLHDNKEQRVVLKFSEEIKYLAVQCLSAVLPAKFKEGRYDSFSSSPYFQLSQTLQEDFFVPIASQCIMKLLNTIRYEQNMDLRLESLRLLSQLLQDNLRDVDILVLSFPGTISSLCATISQKFEKENHQIMCSALTTLGELIQAVMCDDKNKTLSEIHSFSDIFLNKEKDTDTSAIDDSIKFLVMHIDDDYNEVSVTCRIRMQSLLSLPAFEKSIMPILKNNLYDWFMKFPQYVISRDEHEKIVAMSIISGIILLLRDQSERVFSTALSRASDGWMTALEIDKESLHVLEEKQSERYIELKSDKMQSSIPVYPKIRFKYFATDTSTNKLIRLLNIIGKWCDLQAWINHFMRYVSVNINESNDPQAVYIVHALLSGALADDLDPVTESDSWMIEKETCKGKNELLKIIAIQLLNDTMNILINAAATNNKTLSLITTATSSFQLDEEAGHVLTVCFGLQIVGLITCVIDRDYLQDQLITILYPLLAHLGSPNVYIHTYALITLDTISHTCGLNNARELAIQNIDYIINMISQHISVLSNNARVPLVLKALIHVGGYDTINYLDDTVQEIYDALERYSANDWICAQLCSVLFEIIQILEKNVLFNPDKQINTNINIATENSTNASAEIMLFINDAKDNIHNVDEEYKTMEEIGKYFLDRQKKGLHDNMTIEKALLE